MPGLLTASSSFPFCCSPSSHRQTDDSPTAGVNEKSEKHLQVCEFDINRRKTDTQDTFFFFRAIGWKRRVNFTAKNFFFFFLQGSPSLIILAARKSRLTLWKRLDERGDYFLAECRRRGGNAAEGIWKKNKEKDKNSVFHKTTLIASSTVNT